MLSVVHLALSRVQEPGRGLPKHSWQKEGVGGEKGATETGIPSGCSSMSLVLPSWGQRERTQLSFPAPALVISCSPVGGGGNIKLLVTPFESWAQGLRKEGFGPGEGQEEG